MNNDENIDLMKGQILSDEKIAVVMSFITILKSMGTDNDSADRQELLADKAGLQKMAERLVILSGKDESQVFKSYMKQLIDFDFKTVEQALYSFCMVNCMFDVVLELFAVILSKSSTVRLVPTTGTKH